MRNAEADSDTVILKRIEAISGHRQDAFSETCDFQGIRMRWRGEVCWSPASLAAPSPGEGLDEVGHLGAVGSAAALALAAVLALATVVAGLAAALAFAVVLAFTGVLFIVSGEPPERRPALTTLADWFGCPGWPRGPQRRFRRPDR